MQDLSPAQNERLRRAMWAYKDAECGGRVSDLARRMRRAQPSLSDFLNRKGGAAYATALRFAELIQKPIGDVIGPTEQAEDEEDFPAPATVPIADPPIGTFLIHLRERPGLYEAVTAEPGRWRLSTVVRALGETFQSDSAGVPFGGWAKTLDAIQGGLTDVRPGGDVRADTIRQLQARAKRRGK